LNIFFPMAVSVYKELASPPEDENEEGEDDDDFRNR